MAAHGSCGIARIRDLVSYPTLNGLQAVVRGIRREVNGVIRYECEVPPQQGCSAGEVLGRVHDALWWYQVLRACPVQRARAVLSPSAAGVRHADIGLSIAGARSVEVAAQTCFVYFGFWILLPLQTNLLFFFLAGRVRSGG